MPDASGHSHGQGAPEGGAYCAQHHACSASARSQRSQVEPASHVNGGQFLPLALIVCSQFPALKVEIGLFGVCL